jgi:hypothetical protein
MKKNFAILFWKGVYWAQILKLQSWCVFFFELIVLRASISMLSNFVYLLWFLRLTQLRGTSKYQIRKFLFCDLPSSKCRKWAIFFYWNSLRDLRPEFHISIFHLNLSCLMCIIFELIVLLFFNYMPKIKWVRKMTVSTTLFV